MQTKSWARMQLNVWLVPTAPTAVLKLQLDFDTLTPSSATRGLLWARGAGDVAEQVSECAGRWGPWAEPDSPQLAPQI